MRYIFQNNKNLFNFGFMNLPAKFNQFKLLFLCFNIEISNNE